MSQIPRSTTRCGVTSSAWASRRCSSAISSAVSSGAIKPLSSITGSTLISQLIDSLVVTYVAFWWFKGMSFPMATALVLTAYTYKFVVAILSTPLIYLVHAAIESYLGKEKAVAMRAAALR